MRVWFVCNRATSTDFFLEKCDLINHVWLQTGPLTISDVVQKAMAANPAQGSRESKYKMRQRVTNMSSTCTSVIGPRKKVFCHPT